jgi:hypothetical protein
LTPCSFFLSFDDALVLPAIDVREQITRRRETETR